MPEREFYGVLPSGGVLRRTPHAQEAKRGGVTPAPATEIYRSIAAADAEGQTELHKAARSGSAHAIEFAELLIDDGADINERTAQLRTPLQIAIIFRNFKMANMLLDRGADPDTQDVHGRSPLLDAVVGANVSALLRHRGLRLCELHAGEALVIPTFGERHRGGWWHGTCNLGEWTAGFTTFHFPPA